MGFQLAEAYVQLGQRGYGSLMGHIGSVRTGLGSIVSFATGPLGMALGALGTGAGVAGLVGLSAKIEQTETQFKTLLGSSDAAKEKIKELQEFAAGTPFQFDGLADSAKRLLAFGVSSEQVVPTMRVLGDIAAATGNQIGELSNIYGKVKARGALMTESLDQFNERGIPVGAALAEMFGTTEAKIREMASAGQISFAAMQTAMQNMTGEGGIAFEGMASQSTTLGGLWSTLKDNVTLVMTDIGNAIVEGFDLKNSVASFTEFVQRVRGEWMPSLVESIRWASESMIKPFFSFIGRITSSIISFVQDFDLYWEYAYTSLGNQMNNIYQVVSTAFSNAWNVTKWFFENFLEIAKNVVTSIPELFMNSVQQIKNHWDSLINFFKTGRLEFDFSPMADSFKEVFEGIDMPELAAPQLNALESDLNRIADRLAKRQADRAKSKSETDQEELGKGKESLEIEEGITKEKQKQKDTFSGLTELADKMQKSVLSSSTQATPNAAGALQDAGGQQMVQNADQRAQIDAVTKQATLLESLIAMASGQGIRIAMPDGAIEIPDASIKFGAAGTRGA